MPQGLETYQWKDYFSSFDVVSFLSTPQLACTRIPVATSAANACPLTASRLRLRGALLRGIQLVQERTAKMVVNCRGLLNSMPCSVVYIPIKKTFVPRERLDYPRTMISLVSKQKVVILSYSRSHRLVALALRRGRGRGLRRRMPHPIYRRWGRGRARGRSRSWNWSRSRRWSGSGSGGQGLLPVTEGQLIVPQEQLRQLPPEELVLCPKATVPGLMAIIAALSTLDIRRIV